MVIVASIYSRFYFEVRVSVGTCLPTPAPPKIPSIFTALVVSHKECDGQLHQS
jgi:hypothetical protein